MSNIDNIVIEHNLLYLRPGEEYNVVRLDDVEVLVEEYTRIYFICLVTTPELPVDETDEAEYIHPEHKNLALVVAEQYTTYNTGNKLYWGWVHMGATDKAIITNLLLNRGALPNEWWYLLLDTRIHHD